MKRKLLVVIGIVMLMIAVGAAFFAGSYIKEQEYTKSREQRCQRFMLFAIDKVENYDLSESGVREALISDLYVAHELCDNPELDAQLNNLWNNLIYRSDEYIGREDIVVEELRTILGKMQAED